MPKCLKIGGTLAGTNESKHRYINWSCYQAHQPTSMLGVVGLEKEARMMSPDTSHTVQLPSGLAATGERDNTQEIGVNCWDTLAGGWVVMGVVQSR